MSSSPMTRPNRHGATRLPGGYSTPSQRHSVGFPENPRGGCTEGWRFEITSHLCRAVGVVGCVVFHSRRCFLGRPTPNPLRPYLSRPDIALYTDAFLLGSRGVLAAFISPAHKAARPPADVLLPGRAPHTCSFWISFVNRRIYTD